MVKEKGLFYPGKEFRSDKTIKRELALKGQLPPIIEGTPERKTFSDYATIAIARSKDAREFSTQAQGGVKVIVPDEAILNFIADVHAWHPRTNHERFFQEIETIMETPKSYIIFGGDLIEGVFWGGASMEQVGSLDEQKGFMRELWKRTKGRVIAAVSGEHDCIDDKTEALTKRGWLKYDQVREDDKFLTINPKSDSLEWHNYDHIHAYDEEDTDLVEIETRDFSFLGTKNHRMFYQDRKNGEYGFRSAEEFSELKWGNEFIPMASSFNNRDYDISDNQLKLVAWILTDGWIENKKRVRIGQRDEKAHYVRQILQEDGVKFSEVTKEPYTGDVIDGKKIKSRKLFITFEILDKKYKQQLLEYLEYQKKKLPDFLWKISDRQFGIFNEHLMLGDGTRHGEYDAWQFTQKSKSMIDSLQALYSMHNMRSSISSFENTYGTFYRLNVCRRKGLRFNSPRKISRIVKYTGVVWDLTIKNGNFLVRRRDRCYFTGNSKWAAKTGADPYAEFTDLTNAPYKRGLLELTMEAGSQAYSGLIAHRLRGSSLYNNLHPPMRASREIQGHDFYLSGHTHRKGIGIQAVREKDGARNVAFGVSGPYKETDEYAQRSGWIEQKTKQLYGFAIRFAPDVGKIEIDEDIISANAKWG